MENVKLIKMLKESEPYLNQRDWAGLLKVSHVAISKWKNETKPMRGRDKLIVSMIMDMDHDSRKKAYAVMKITGRLYPYDVAADIKLSLDRQPEAFKVLIDMGYVKKCS